MTFEEVINIMNDEKLEYVPTKKYKVRYKDYDGVIKTKNIRMFINNYDNIGYFYGKKTKYGIVLQSYEYAKWLDLKPYYPSNVSNVVRMRKRALDAFKMLEKSGLWKDIKNEIVAFLQLDESEQKAIADCDNLYGLYLQKKYEWFRCPSIFEAFRNVRCWEYISTDKYTREHEEKMLAEAIREKRGYHHRWTEDYDRSVEVGYDEKTDTIRAWFSKEYRGCGNGHYYLMFDEKHAIFYEDD